MGINSDLTDAILDSNFDKIRKSKSASAWAIDTFRTSWEFLEGLDGSSSSTPTWRNAPWRNRRNGRYRWRGYLQPQAQRRPEYDRAQHRENQRQAQHYD
ncbi:hypothetical protein B0T21DRAFT_451750 [Apiosordaria backusii]|uniref:Uncharacterized protein n=1 Tax=Apiosordaria backusii TaxID=314023 RepID=A0AA40BK79_9PEZI|nr:hypothetical protein B0T21DRAFT_451750 [Apiosordaria backusii]